MVLENPERVGINLLKCTVLVTKVVYSVVAMDGEERCLKTDNVGRTFSSLTILLGGKSLKLIHVLEIEFMPICRLNDVLLISGCTFVGLCDSRLFFAQNFKRLLVILPFEHEVDVSDIFPFMLDA